MLLLLAGNITPTLCIISSRIKAAKHVNEVFNDLLNPAEGFMETKLSSQTECKGVVLVVWIVSVVGVYHCSGAGARHAEKSNENKDQQTEEKYVVPLNKGLLGVAVGSQVLVLVGISFQVDASEVCEHPIKQAA